MKRMIAIAACLAVLSAAETVDVQKRAEELKSLKWGMFVCWSFSTFSGKEWTPGVKDIAAFRATGCDTDQWARTAKEAGMGYRSSWFYSLPKHDGLCRPAKDLYRDYRGAVKYGNIFSLDVGPDYAGRLRKIDVETLQAVGEMIKHPPAPAPEPTPQSDGKPAKAS